MKEQVYRVIHKPSGERRIVVAPTKSRALSHVAESVLEVERLTPLEALEVANRGVTIERVVAATKTAEEPAATASETQAEDDDFPLP